jgi:DNA-binding transcriptional ArsR family regulator
LRDLLSRFNVGDFEFKEAWRAGRSLAVIVPIVAKRVEARGYVVLEEVQDKVRITDTGRIGEVKVEGQVDKPTFIRGGTMLKGATQERATEFSVVIMPEKASATIPVHCVHATKGIRPAAQFSISTSYTPPTVYSAMLATQNQTVTWTATANYSANLLARLPPSTSGWGVPQVKHDDLVGVQESIAKFRKDLEEMLKQIPDYINQVGTVVIDPDGVLGLEMFNHPDSWKAVTEKVKRAFTEALTREDKAGIFKPDFDAALAVVNAFLEKLEKLEEEKEVFSQANAKTIIFKVEGYVGEYTTLNNKTIHLTITRKGKEEQRIPHFPSILRATPYRFPPIEPTTPAIAEPSVSTAMTAVPEPLWRKRKKRMQVLKSLEQPKTWTSLASELKMSKATLSASLKQFQTMGIVEKYQGTNGVTRYTLTPLGHEIKKRLGYV